MEATLAMAILHQLEAELRSAVRRGDRKAIKSIRRDMTRLRAA